jgi:hypothetical protein
MYLRSVSVSRLRSIRLFVGVLLSLLQANAMATCECASMDIDLQMQQADFVFVGRLASARLKVIAEYRYFRLPGKKSWVSESSLTQEEKRTADSRISKDREIWGMFEDFRILKGKPNGSKEIRMGDSICPMLATIGNVYLVVSRDGKSTSYCEGGDQLEDFNDPRLVDVATAIERASRTKVPR